MGGKNSWACKNSFDHFVNGSTLLFSFVHVCMAVF